MISTRLVFIFMPYMFYKGCSVAFTLLVKNHIGERIGEKREMNCGSVGRIIEYRNAEDIDIDFGEGRIARHKKYANFVKGSIRIPSVK